MYHNDKSKNYIGKYSDKLNSDKVYLMKCKVCVMNVVEQWNNIEARMEFYGVKLVWELRWDWDVFWLFSNCQLAICNL